MSPEYGCTCSYFPIDGVTLQYLRLTGRPDSAVRVVEAYAKEQGLWAYPEAVPRYSTKLTLDLAIIQPSVAGPSRPQDRMPLSARPASVQRFVEKRAAPVGVSDTEDKPAAEGVGQRLGLRHGTIAIAAITSCTNTSNPEVMIAAGLLARKARDRGMRCPAWVKTSLAPGSPTVVAYLERAGLLHDLQDLGFWVVGFGCMTCMGNSGNLTDLAERARSEQGVALAARGCLRLGRPDGYPEVP